MKNKQKKLLSALFVIVSSILALVVSPKDSYAEHTLSLSASSAQVIDASSSGTGTSISESEISVTTTCQAGYNLALSTSVDDNNLYLNGDTNNYATGNYFSPSDGIASLVSADNTWGYYLPDLGGETPNAESIFSAVPVLSHPVTLKTPAQTASDSEINDTFSIYYGVKVSGNLSAGTYTMAKDTNEATGALVYYATLSEDCFRYTIKYSPTGTNTGSSVTGAGVIEDQYVAEGVEGAITSEVYGNPTIDGVTYYFTGWNTAQDGTGVRYTSGQSFIDLATPGTTIILYAQWTDCPSDHVCYNKNHSDAIGTMGQQESASVASITLMAPNFSLPGYGFVGWSEDPEAAAKLVNDETVIIYGPNETLTTGDLSADGLRLYAVWLEATESLQEWSNCGSLEVGDVIALQDARDTNAYSVAKLADGNCWMIENLRLESENSLGDKAMLAQAYNESFTGLANPEDSNFSESSTANSLYSTNGTTENRIGGDYLGHRFPRYNNNNTVLGSDTPTEGNTNLYYYGNYYTWSAAIADTTSYFAQNTMVDTTSICPKGWRIPRGGDKTIEATNDFWALIVDGINNGVKPSNYNSFSRSYYNGSTEGRRISELLKSFPNNFTLSGYYSGSSAVNRNSMDGYWTSVTSTNNGAYTLSIESERVDPGTSFAPKYRGNSIRCLYDGGN